MKSIQQQGGMANVLGSQAQQKSFKFHQHLRSKHIQRYKQQVRKQFNSITHLNELLVSLPQELDDVLRWCRTVMQQFNNTRSYKFPDYQIIQLFKLVQKFPCLETIQLMYLLSHKMSTVAIHQLFQYDIVGLLHRLIQTPEKIVPRVLMRCDSNPSQCICIEIVKKTMLLLAALCEESEKARNFIVTSHKSYLCISQAYQKLGKQIDKQFILCLYSFMCHKIAYDEQFVRIIKCLCVNFCNKSDTMSSHQIILMVKGLISAVKCKERWSMDLIQSGSQYEITDTMLKMLKASNKIIQTRTKKQQTQQHENSYKSLLKNMDQFSNDELSELIHVLNLFLIHYIQVSTNQYFEWQNFLSQWFTMLSLLIDSKIYTCFHDVRRDIFFILNNIICEAEEPQSGYHLLRSMVFQHKCIHIFSHCLEKQTNQEVIQQLGYCIHSILSYRDVQMLAKNIMDSQLVNQCLYACTRQFYSANYDTKQTLIGGLLKLINRTQNRQIRNHYIYQIKCYRQKLNSICLLQGNNNSLEEIVDRLLGECLCQ